MKPLAVILFVVLALVYLARGQVDTNGWTIIAEDETVPPHFFPPPVMDSTNPPAPTFPLSLVPASASNEIVKITRDAIDLEQRPKVYFQKRKLGSLTNDWETILVLEPYQLVNFYRVVIK